MCIRDRVVIGATCQLQRKSDEALVAESLTDEMGDIVFEDVEPDDYYLWVKKEGYLTRWIDANVSEKDCAIPELQIFAEPTAS